MVRYVQQKGRLMILQVSLKLPHRSTWNFRTIFGQRKCVRRCSIVPSQQIQDGGRPPFWRSLNHHISVKNHPILMKFGTLHQILNPITVTWPKIEFSLESDNRPMSYGQKSDFQDVGGRHLENRFLAITHRPIVRFQLNFVWGSRTVCRRGLHDKNCKFLKSKMADGRHFENCQIAISQSKIVRFWWNSVHYSKC